VVYLKPSLGGRALNLWRAVSLAFLLGTGCSVHAVTIDFETGVFLQEIGDDFAGQGVRFRNFLSSDTSDGPKYNRNLSPFNLFAMDLNRPPGTDISFNVTGDFTSPISSISVGAIAATGTRVVMTAFDADGTVLATLTSGQSPAANTVFETMSLSGIGDISVVRWETDCPTVCAPGIDNLTFFLAGIDAIAQDTSLKAGSATTTGETVRASTSLQTTAISQRTSTRLQGARAGSALGLWDLPLGDSAMAAGDDFAGWRLWASVLDSDVSNDLPATAFDADVATLLIGADTTIDEELVVGAAFSYETSDVNTFFNAGSQDIDTYAAMAYLGFLFAETFSFDAVFGAAMTDIDQSRTFGSVIQGEQDAYRWFGAANVNMFTQMGDFYIDLSSGLSYARDHLNAFTETGAVLPAGGLENPASSVRIGQWRLGGIVTYPVGAVELFGSAFHVYDFTRTKVVVGPGQTAPSDDRTDVQLGGGLRYVGTERITASLEYTTVLGRTNVDADVISAMVSLEF